MVHPSLVSELKSLAAWRVNWRGGTVNFLSPRHGDSLIAAFINPSDCQGQSGRHVCSTSSSASDASLLDMAGFLEEGGLLREEGKVYVSSFLGQAISLLLLSLSYTC